MFLNRFKKYGKLTAFVLRQDKGRTMVELLAVLSLIGVVSIGGMYGFNYTMHSYKNGESVNEIALSIQGAKGLQVVEKYASKIKDEKAYVVPVKELISNVNYVSDSSSDEKGSNAYLTHAQTPVWVRVEDENGFTVNISGLSRDMCRKVITTNPGFFAAFKGQPSLTSSKVTLEQMTNSNKDSSVYHASDLNNRNTGSQQIENLCSSIAKEDTMRSQASIYREYLAKESNSKNGDELTLDDLLDKDVADKANVDMSPLVLYFKTPSVLGGERDEPSFSCEANTPYNKYDYDNGVQRVSPVCCSGIGGKMVNGVCCALDSGYLTGKDWSGLSHQVCASGMPLDEVPLCQENTSLPYGEGEPKPNAWCCASDPKGAHASWVPKAGSSGLDAGAGTCCKSGYEIENRDDHLEGPKNPACCKMQKRRGAYVPTPFEAGTNLLTETCCKAAGYIWGGNGVCCDGKYQVNSQTGVIGIGSKVTPECCQAYGDALGKFCKEGPREGTCCCSFKRVSSPNQIQNGMCVIPKK